MPNSTLIDYGWWRFNQYYSAHLAANSKTLVAVGAAEFKDYTTYHNRAEKFDNGVWTQIEDVGHYSGL